MDRKIFMHDHDERETLETPRYEVPSLVTYTDEEMLDLLGPTQTLYGIPGQNAGIP